ncbi:tetraspanin 42Ep isoform 2-T2 [Glossina fuscipes fuscipes]
MGVAITIVKWFVFTLNFLCLFLGIGTICLNAFGVEDSSPGTDAHTYYILGILLCSLLCLTIIIGCYGIFSEILGFNIIYSLFVLALLIIQCLQMHSFQPHSFYFDKIHSSESTWSSLANHPSFKSKWTMPASCYEENPNQLAPDPICLEASLWQSYQFKLRRQQIFNWALLISETNALFYSIILCVLLYRRVANQRRQRELARASVRHNPGNHVGMQTHLLSC